MPTEIYTQGHFDGACFLYAICNAYSALTGGEVTSAKWNKLIPKVPFLQDFMSEKGTDGIDDNILECISANMLNAISSKYAFKINRCDKKSLNKKINNTSVAIFAIAGDTEKQKKLDHWVCGVGAEKSNILIACSCIGYNKSPEEVTSTCLKTGRLYNDKVLSDKVIVDDKIFIVTLTN